MQIYLDLVWLLNLFFDWLVLLVVAWVMKLPFTHTRLFLASLYASLIIPLTFVTSLDWLGHPVIKIIYSVGIILIAFNIRSVKTFIKYMFSFYFINFAIGGGLFGLHFFLQSQNVEFPWLTYIGYGNSVSWIFIVISFPIFLWFTKDRLQHLSVTKLHHQQLYDVSVQLDDRRIYQLKGFYDTGNQLTHPLVNKPIMLIDEPTASNWFGQELVERLKHKPIDDTNSEYMFEYIPLKKAGGDHGYIPVIQVNQISIHVNQLIHSTKRVYIGIHFGKFSSQISYNSLLHPLLLQSKNTKVQETKGVS